MRNKENRGWVLATLFGLGLATLALWGGLQTAEAQTPATSKLYSSGNAGLSVTTGNTAVTFTDTSFTAP